MALLKIDMALSFVQAGEEDIDRIQEVAYTSWRSHYPGIISDAQIEFMLAKMYSKEAIQEQLLIQIILFTWQSSETCCCYSFIFCF